MEYLIEVKRNVSMLVKYKVKANNRGRAIANLELGKPFATEFLDDPSLAKSEDSVVCCEVVDDIDDRPAFFLNTPVVELDIDNPLVEIVGRRISGHLPSPGTPKTVKVGKGKSATAEAKEPEPIQIAEALEYEGGLWVYSGGSFRPGVFREYYFTRIIPREQYTGSVAVRIHQHGYRYQTMSGLLAIYGGKEYVFLDTERVIFRVYEPGAERVEDSDE